MDRRKPTKEVIELANKHISGNIIASAWYSTVKKKNGKVDLVAITILAEVFYWYRPKYILDDNQNLVGIEKKFHGEYLQIDYQDLYERFNLTRAQALAGLLNLERLGLVKRDFRHIKDKRGRDLSNVMFLIPNIKKILEFSEGSYEIREANDT